MASKDGHHSQDSVRLAPLDSSLEELIEDLKLAGRDDLEMFLGKLRTTMVCVLVILKEKIDGQA